MSQIERQCEAFLASRQSVVLSTRALNGELESSVVPFVMLESDEFAILVSELAQHTQNLLALLKRPDTEYEQTSSNTKSAGLVAGLLLADECQTEQLFARERLSLQMAVERVALDSEERTQILLCMKSQFGEVVDVLAGLPDFHCFKLKVVSGRYVRGFGAAYEFLGCPCKALQAIKGR